MVDTLNSNAVVGRASGQSLPPVSGWVDSDVAFDGKREDALLAAKANPMFGVPSPQCRPRSPQVTVCFVSVVLAPGSSRLPPRSWFTGTGGNHRMKVQKGVVEHRENLGSMHYVSLSAEPQHHRKAEHDSTHL